MRRIGYARVSTEDQHLDLQLQALNDAGCTRIYRDQGISGTVDSRPGLDKLLTALREGDELIVWRLDRLGRSLIHLVRLIEQLGQRGIRFRSLTESIDTSSSGGRLVFHIMAALAEFERALIAERTRAGLAAAKSKGKRLGRPHALTKADAVRAIKLKQMGTPTIKVALEFGVSERTVRRLMQIAAA